MIVQALQRHGAFAFQDHPGTGRVQPGAELGRAFGHGVEEDAVHLQVTHQLDQRLQVGLAFAPRAGVPGIVVNIDPGAAFLDRGDGASQAGQSARHVAIEIELIAVVHADARVGVPEHEAVVAAELAEAVVQELMDPVGAAARIVEGLVAHHDEAAGERGCRPGKLRPAVERVVVLKPAAGLLAPPGQLLAEGRPLLRVAGRRDDVPARVENKSRRLRAGEQRGRSRRASARCAGQSKEFASVHGTSAGTTAQHKAGPSTIENAGSRRIVLPKGAGTS